VTRCAAALSVALALLGAPAATFAAGCPRTTVTALEDEVMCQVCGVPLGLAGDAPQAQRVRAFIAAQAVQCRTKRQIESSLVAQFGPSVLADPPHRGFSLSAYLVPLLAVGGAALLLGWLGLDRRRRRPLAGGHPPAVPPLDASDRARVNSALERWTP
jgi:cytochrome c-type biogenesis protein CcmH/NrfF